MIFTAWWCKVTDLMALHGALCMYSITLTWEKCILNKIKKFFIFSYFLGGRRPVVVLGQWIDNEERQGHRHPSPYRPHNPPGCQIWAPIWYFINYYMYIICHLAIPVLKVFYFVMETCIFVIHHLIQIFIIN